MFPLMSIKSTVTEDVSFKVNLTFKLSETGLGKTERLKFETSLSAMPVVEGARVVVPLFQESPLELPLLFPAKPAYLNVTEPEAGDIHLKLKFTLPVEVVFPLPV